MSKKVRIGIDVGGTFTDAVVVSNDTGELIAKKKVPTTHHHKNGVSQGIVDSIESVLEEANISPKDVTFIAHGTTQATNSVLEGDVAKIGLISLGDTKIHDLATRVKTFDISFEKPLQIYQEYICRKELASLSFDDRKKKVKEAIETLINKGAEVIVATEVFGVDDAKFEEFVAKVAEEMGHYATNGTNVSQLYGVKIRTKTAIINGGLIPKMVETAKMTDEVVKKLEIPSELMVMRSDGGVMGVHEMYKRPILTMMSGLAAGVAGVLMHEKLSNGVFIEVGGTSVDISVIKDGEVVLKTAQIGKNKTTLKSLDIRTLGVAGGSMIRIKNGKVVDVGPRSAHLAHLEYECFTKEKIDDKYFVKEIQPMEGDPSDYIVISNDKNTFSYTLAGAVNYLGYVPEDDYAFAKNVESNKKAWEVLGKHLGREPKAVAEEIVKLAVDKTWKVIAGLLRNYKMNVDQIELVGGGGSASILTYPIGKIKNVKHKIAKNAPFISTIGVAMAMIREEISKSIIDPSVDDLVKLRKEVIDKLVESGAKEETITTKIEVDKQKNIVIATGTGASDFNKTLKKQAEVDDDSMKQHIQESISSTKGEPEKKFVNGNFNFWNANGKVKLAGLFNLQKSFGVVSDNEGVISFKMPGAIFEQVERNKVSETYLSIIEKYSTYSDAGQAIPGLYMFVNNKVFNYLGIVNYDELTQLMALDLEHVSRDADVTFMILPKK